MIAGAFVLSIIVALIRGGKLRNLERIPLRHVWLFVLPFALSFGMCYAQATTGSKALLPYVRVTNVVQYLILLSAIYINRHVLGMWLVGLGALCQTLVVAANGGVMPVSMSAMKIAGLYDLVHSTEYHWNIRHALLAPETRLKILADIIPVRLIDPSLSEVASIGDVFLALGVFVMVQLYLCMPYAESKESDVAG